MFPCDYFSMLLDRGVNMLYLSHDIPGMESLESLYIFIWQKVCLSKQPIESIEADVLYDIYGTVNADDLKAIGLNESKERQHVWDQLVEQKIIDNCGKILITKTEEITAERVDNVKLVYYLRDVLQRERRIHVPLQLLPFVERHLRTWVMSAFKAAFVLEAGHHYVVDEDRSRKSPDLSPQVTIIDPDTGTDQSSSQWDGALHQFLQLKEGCRLTLQSLKAVFVSNVSYFRLYKTLVGLTGTLGSQPEREFLKTTYCSDYMTVPTASPKQFKVKPSQVIASTSEWLAAIIKETRRIIVEEKRSLIIFCRSINQVKQVYNQIRRDVSDDLLDANNIHQYTRDYENFGFESRVLDVGHVIVATNLAGRGTDIKISDQLETNGGLHVCLTYLPENVRIEEQAMGRSGRKGTPGSGILIIRSEHDGTENIFDLKEERNRNELQRISQLHNEFINGVSVQEKCFQRFTETFTKLKNNCIALKKWTTRSFMSSV